MSFVFKKRMGGAKADSDQKDSVNREDDEYNQEEANDSETDRNDGDQDSDEPVQDGDRDSDEEEEEEDEAHDDNASEVDDDDDADDDDDDDDDADDADEDGDEYLEKLKRMKTVDDLHVLHHELEQHNYEEVLERAKVIRNEANLIVDSNHRTIPYVTKYERARILGVRTKQLNAGHSSTIQTRYRNNSIVAQEEYQQKKIPFIIRRPLPNGTSEYWRFADLEQIS